MKRILFFILFLSFGFLACAQVKAPANELSVSIDKAILQNDEISDQLVLNSNASGIVAATSASIEVIDQDYPDTPGPDDAPTVKSYSEWFYLLYGVLIFIFGEVGKLFGLKDILPKYKYVFVVVSFGIVIGAGFIWHGMSFFMMALTLASTLGIYDVLTGLFKKPPAVIAE